MGDVYQFEMPLTTVEVIKDHLEDGSVKTLIGCMVDKNGDLYIFDSGDNSMQLDEISFFAHYFEKLRQQILEEMFFDSEEI